ncbi:hypothetical protein KDI_44930 [Dictyobacter arantiisoli]|uniref:Uncharacterized protein n=1 Tax=Dictyobacter arantiisoli TaxID=2014874 RepID=A0A5A5TIV9_9CHLR|nr:hypothetical protein KDI_44930 [Dictyobacter arantiisoli]
MPAYNNVGISYNSTANAGHFDTSGYSYSQNALITTNIEPGLPFIYDGIQFGWPNIDNKTNSTQPDNWQASGQVLPISQTNTQVIGFIGSATNGAGSGTVTVTYSDNSTENFSLGLSDWTLGGGKLSPSYGNAIVAVQPYRNGQGGTQTVKTYLFYATIHPNPTKQAVSVKLPSSTGNAQLHIFTYGARAASYTTPYNNTGMSDDAYPGIGNFDGGGASYSAAAIGWGTGYTIYYNQNLAGSSNMSFQWPDVLPGTPDNYQANGQTIAVTPLASATKIGFVGAATGGPSVGTALINYTDGSQTSFQLGFSDWTLNAYSQPPSYGNHYFYAMPDRNTRTGQQQLRTFLFYTETNVDPTKTVKSVTLPSTTNQGHIHVYSIATGVAGFFDSVGVTDDNRPIFGNFDGGGRSYSGEALQSAGILFSTSKTVRPFTINGTSFTVMYGAGLSPDNWVANGQVIPVNDVTGANALAFLGSATGGASTGSVTLNYSDGTVATAPLSFSDWCASTGSTHNYIAAALSYRNTAYGKQATKNYLYYNEVPLAADKTLVSVQLPQNTVGGTMHIFAAAERSGNYNNVGITNDNAPAIGAFDGNNGSSYSAQALQSAGLVANQNFGFNGYSFAWPAAGTLDNNIVAAQVLNVTPPVGAKTVAFLGSAINGGTSGKATITYADGHTQVISLSFADWCNNTSGTVAATMSYRNTHTGKQQIKNYIYFAEFTIDSTSTVQSITLPGDGFMHIFSYAFK